MRLERKINASIRVGFPSGPSTTQEERPGTRPSCVGSKITEMVETILQVQRQLGQTGRRLAERRVALGSPLSGLSADAGFRLSTIHSLEESAMA